MNRKNGYNTSQRQAILNYLQSLDGTHTTVKEIMRYLQESGISIGLTTVYRHIEKLVECGSVKKYLLGEADGACFQYFPEQAGRPMYFHLKCEKCGELTHLQCSFLDELQKHIMDKHRFSVNQEKTIFYGVCAECAK